MADAIKKLPPYLPREVIFSILINVPIQTLVEVVRYVCKQWYDIVSDPLFVSAHCQKSSLGFLFQDRENFSQVNYIEVDMPTPKSTKVQNPSHAEILCSLNGLVLLSYYSTNNIEIILDVVNPMTKEKISLPPVARCLDPKPAVLAVNSSGHYKVVHASEVFYKVLQIWVFTIGVDKSWRLIDLHGTPVSVTMNYYRDQPHCCRQYIYWFPYANCFGLALDVDTETIYRFTGPKYKFDFSKVKVVSLETSIGVIDKSSTTLLKVWKLTDVKSSEWTEFARINVEPVYSLLFGSGFTYVIYQVGLFGGVFWFYCCVGEKYVVVRKNLADERFEFFEIGRGVTLHPHASTFVSPGKLIA